MATLQLLLLGTPRIIVDGAIVELPERKAIALLAYLAAADHARARATLAALFWPDSDATRARGSLRHALSAIRQAIGPDWLTVEAEVVQLHSNNSASPWLDTSVFRAESAQARRHGHDLNLPCPTCLAHLTHAAELWRGEFLDGLDLLDAPGFEEWRFFEGETFRREATDVFSRLSAAQAAQGDLTIAIESTRRWLALDPLHEPAHRALMRLYAQDGQRSAALRQYRECARVLAAELQTAPDPETETLHAQIMAGWPQSPTADQVELAPIHAAPSLPAFLRDDFPIAARPPFVGRADPLDLLNDVLRRADRGQGQVLFVTGEAGSGKSSLLGAFLRSALDAHPDLVVGFGACSALAGMGDPYQPFREALAMLTGDLDAPLASGLIEREHAIRLWRAVPEALSALVEHGPALAPALLSGGSLLERARSALLSGDATLLRLRRLLEAGEAASGNSLAQLCGQYADVLRALAASGPVLLALDDLQWSDPGSVGLLFHLSRALAEMRVCIVGAFRPEEVALDERGPHPMAKVLAEVQGRSGEVNISLDHIAPAARQAFVDALLNTEPNALGDSFRTALLRHTEGHALFTVEALRDLHEQGQLITTRDRGWVEAGVTDWTAIPAGVEGVIAQRLERLSPRHQRLLDAASVEGERFTAQVAARVAGLAERDALHELEHALSRVHSLVTYEGTTLARGRAVDRFRFRHSLIQRRVYDHLGPAERRLLHGEVGAALEALHDDSAGELAADLGRHFELAGNGPRAIPYLLRAGDQARLAYAGDAAIEFYRRAVTLQEHEKDEETLARTFMRLALTYNARLDYEQSGRAYRRAFEIWGLAGQGRRSAGIARQRFRFVMNYGFTADSWTLAHLLYRGLISTSEEMEVLPDLAESWEIARDGMRYTFTLRDDARWSDGKPVTAEDFEASWKHRLKPGAPDHWARLFYDVRGAEAYHTGVAASSDAVGVRARNSRTLVIDLERPAAYFLYALTADALYPGPAPSFSIPAGPPQHPDQWLVNGPYRVKNHHPGRWLLIRNPDYHGRFDGNVDEIEVFEYEDLARDQALGIEWYETGAIDMLDITDYPSAIRRPAAARHSEEITVVHEPGTLGFAFDVTQPPFDDIRVRRAFCMAFDRERFNRVCREPVSPVTGGLIPPRIMGYTPGIELAYDPPLARSLLAEAGYPNGNGLPRLSWVGMNNTGSEETRHFFQEMYARNLGIDPGIYDVSEPSVATWWRDMSESVKPIGSIFWYALGYAYPDPDCYLRNGYGQMIRNHNGWQHPGYDRLTDAARVHPDPVARGRLYRQADAMLMQAAALMPIWYRGAVLLVKPWVKWMPMYPDGAPQFEHMIIEPH